MNERGRRGLFFGGVFGLLSLVCAPCIVHAQEDPFDALLWLEAGMNARITKLFRIAGEQHLRLNRDLSELDSIMTELRPWLKFDDAFRIEAGYRFIYGRDGGNSELQAWHRFFGGARFDLDLDPVRIDLRLRYQAQLRFEGIDVQEHTARARLRTSWEIDDTTLFASYELFTRIADEEAIAAHKWRAGLGVQYEFEDCALSAEIRYESFFLRDRSSLIFGLSFVANWER
jgi:hypothetical protein